MTAAFTNTSGWILSIIALTAHLMFKTEKSWGFRGPGSSHREFTVSSCPLAFTSFLLSKSFSWLLPDKSPLLRLWWSKSNLLLYSDKVGDGQMGCCAGSQRGGGGGGEAGCPICPDSRVNPEHWHFEHHHLSGPTFSGETREEKPLKRISCSKIVKALKMRG